MTPRITKLFGFLLGAVALPVLANAAPHPVIKGPDLAIRWPQLLGTTVQVDVTPVQALDAVRYFVKIDGVSAVLFMLPNQAWTGRKTVCATVMGSQKIARGGRTQVVGLMLKRCGE